MQEEKKTFKEKWQDKKYQAKVKLSGYGIFVVIILLMLSFGGNNTSITNEINDIPENNPNETVNNEVIFNKPAVNNYTYKITITTKKDTIQKTYYYHGKVLDTYEELVKEIDTKQYNYKITDNKYYILNNNNYLLTTKEEVYDIIDYSYLNIDNINNYLSYSKLVDNKYQVYLNDIILDSTSTYYITISLEENLISIDYTNLVNYLNNEEYDSYIVSIEYTE